VIPQVAIDEYTEAMTDTLTLNPGHVSDSDLAALAAFATEQVSAGKRLTVIAEDVLLTPEEVAQRLNLSRTTIRRRIADGELKSIKVGTHHRIPYPEYQRFAHELMVRFAQASGADIEAELFGA